MNWIHASLSILVIVSLFAATDGLQCYQCSGQTNYDPALCFDTDPGRTVVTECPMRDANVACEKRVERIDRRSKIINRGCTVNCQERDYVYTDDFQVYCCRGDRCNAAATPTPHLVAVLALAVATIAHAMNVLVS